MFADFKPYKLNDRSLLAPRLIRYNTNSVDFEHLQSLEERLAALAPPPWPARLFGLDTALAAKAELARIGRYYATESMLVLDPATGRYDARATPSTGTDTLFDHYARLVRGEATVERGDHAVF